MFKNIRLDFLIRKDRALSDPSAPLNPALGPSTLCSAKFTSLPGYLIPAVVGDHNSDHEVNDCT